MQQVNDPDEVLDLIDENENVIGKLVRRDIPKLEAGEIKGIYRAVDGFIVNSKAQLWIPRRSMNRVYAPGGLDTGVGEHVRAGETYAEALIRGFKEEANIDVTLKDLEYVGKLDLREIGLPIFEQVYIYRGNKEPEFNNEEFTGYEWLTPNEILERINNGEVVKKNLKSAIDLIVGSGKVI